MNRSQQYSANNSNNNNNNNKQPNNQTSTPCTTLQGYLLETYWSSDHSVTDHRRQTNVVPALDLSSLGVGDNDEQGEKTDETSDRPVKGLRGAAPHDRSGENSALFVKKKCPNFVFPSEKTVGEYGAIHHTNTTHTRYSDPTTTGLSPHLPNHLTAMSTSTKKNSGPESDVHNAGRRGSQSNGGGSERTISFSLANPKLGKYLMFEDETPNGKVATKDEDVKKGSNEKPSHSKRKEGQHKHVVVSDSDSHDSAQGARDRHHRLNPSPESESDAQEIIDVVIVDGHLNKASDHDRLNLPESEDDTDEENKIAAEKANEEKPQKPRVTFSFDNDFYSHRSLRRFNPVQHNVNMPLQSVLKKRPEPVQVPCETNEQSGSRHDYFKDNNSAFRTSKHQETLPYPEQGIPVKNIHSTGSDVAYEARRAKVSLVGTATEKPPLPYNSTRIALPIAEKSAVGSSRRIHLAYANSSNGRGRVAYFRAIEGKRSGENMKSKSRSVEDINGGVDPRFIISGQGSASKSSMPYTLRRSVSSDHAFTSGGSSKSRPGKPKIAFGSFIIPKEATPRLKNAQMKFHDMAPPPHMPIGSYVHSHTRRSPYAAPATVLFKEDHTAFAASSNRRPYTATHSQQQHHQQQQQHHQSVQGKQLAQRHSAPSSYGQNREQSSWRGSRQRLTIDSSPSRQPTRPPNAVPRGAPGTHAGSGVSQGGGVIAAHELLPNKMRVAVTSSNSTSSPGSGQPALGFQQRRPDIATLNMMANKAKGVSQNRFLAKLHDAPPN